MFAHYICGVANFWQDDYSIYAYRELSILSGVSFMYVVVFIYHYGIILNSLTNKRRFVTLIVGNELWIMLLISKLPRSNNPRFSLRSQLHYKA